MKNLLLLDIHATRGAITPSIFFVRGRNKTYSQTPAGRVCWGRWRRQGCGMRIQCLRSSNCVAFSLTCLRTPTSIAGRRCRPAVCWYRRSKGPTPSAGGDGPGGRWRRYVLLPRRLTSVVSCQILHAPPTARSRRKSYCRRHHRCDPFWTWISRISSGAQIRRSSRQTCCCFCGRWLSSS